jgi:D-apionolactonase
MAAPSLNNPLSDLVRHGVVAPVYCEGREILRRIFVTVRDRYWREVGPTQWNSTLGASQRRVMPSARHSSEEVDFEWQGALDASADLRTLRFAFEGRALRDMEVCRLGLVVLHPVDSLIGARLTAVGPHGEQRITVTRTIHPQPIVEGVPGAMMQPFSHLTIERPDFGTLGLSFEGDLFEIEDQRNWGDASFKTYCTPLRLGFPRALKAGTVIAHSVRMQFTPPSVRIAVPAQQQEIEAVPMRFPAIGRQSRGLMAAQASSEDETAWHHVHVDLAGRDPATFRALLEAPWPPKIQIGLEAVDAQNPALKLSAMLRAHRERISNVLIYGPGTSLPSPAAIKRWRDEFNASVGLDIPLRAATRGYFVEFNRVRPLMAPVSGIAFPLSATVHSDDAQTIMDNVATIRDIAETARQLAPGMELAIAPLALYHPQRAAPTTFPNQLLVPWLTATLTYAAASGITSITLGEDIVQSVQALQGVRTSEFFRCLIESIEAQISPPRRPPA